MASIFSSKEKLFPIFGCFSVPIASKSNIPQLCLAVLSLLTTYAPCLEAMVADGSSLLLLLEMLHYAPSCREGALHVLYALASTPELAWAAAKHGGVVYILELLLPLQSNDFFLTPTCLFILKSHFIDYINYGVQKIFPYSREQQQLPYWGSLLGSQCMGLELL